MRGHHWFILGLLLVGAYLLYRKGMIKAPAVTPKQPMQEV